MKKLTNFLELNGKIIVFLNKNGVYWIALKPICEALNVSFNHQHRTILADPILRPESSNQMMQVPGDQMRKYFCLSEKFIYGWIFSIQSDSPELIEYKRKCYSILYDHFHGSLTKRQTVLVDRAGIRTEIENLRENLKANPEYLRLNDLTAKDMRIQKDLNKLDNELMNGQLLLFTNEQ